MIQQGDEKTPDAALARVLSDRLKDKGFLVSHAGMFSNVLKIRPAIVFSRENAAEILCAFDECMEEIRG